MPKTKTAQHCGMCVKVEGSEQDCRCFCHSTKQDLEFEEPEPQWNVSEAEVLSIVDSERSDSV